MKRIAGAVLIRVVSIERIANARFVMLSLPEYQRLVLLDHVATGSSEMPDEDCNALRYTRVSQESINLHALKDQSGSG
jgi:hypothetical protein